MFPAADPNSPPVLALSAASRRALELDDLLALVAAQASSDLGREHVTGLVPLADHAALTARRHAFEDAERLLAEQALVPSFEEPLAPLLAGLVAGGQDLSGRHLLALARLIRVAAAARERILGPAATPGERSRREVAVEAPPPPAAPALAPLVAGLVDLTPLAQRIERMLDRRGEVREDATPELGRLRTQIRRVRDQLYQELGGIAGRHRDVAEETIPLRGGRLMLLLDAGARGRLGGLVHGRSATAKSFYFEPLEVVETNNQLQQATEDEEAERRRVLAELLAAARAALPALQLAAAVVAELDGLQAASRFARLAEARLAELPAPDEAPTARFFAARHPLLDPRLADLREEVLGQAGHRGAVVPLELALGESTRALVVTGPNAGGKTVVLKTLGLLTLAHQCGLPIPVGAGTRLPCLRAVVATVGDEQDLLADRSTFSGRLLRLREAWDEAVAGRALLLLDELGSGTDPEEGAALSIALLEALLLPPSGPGAGHGVAAANLALITTHLTQLAAAALELEGAACAAMEFLAATGQPSYRLLPGPPGGSEAIALGRRLGLAPAWLGRAEALLGSEHRQLRRLLSELEAARQVVAETQLRLDLAAGDAEKLRDRLDRERAAMEAERRSLAKRLERELDTFRRSATERLRGEVERVRREAGEGRHRRLAEEAAARLLAEAPTIAVEPEPSAGPLVVGARVRHRLLGWTGELTRLERDRADVTVGGKRLRCSPGDLDVLAGGTAATRAAQAARAPAAAGGAGSRRVANAADLGGNEPPPELNLIGRRVEEALEALDLWLDEALRSSRRELRVVHGHGTGRLRDAVRDHLRRHPGVAAQRPGGDGEGGNGATVVSLRDL